MLKEKDDRKVTADVIGDIWLIMKPGGAQNPLYRFPAADEIPDVPLPCD